MIPSTQITNAEIFTLIAILVFKLSDREILFLSGKHNTKLLKRKLKLLWVN